MTICISFKQTLMQTVLDIIEMERNEEKSPNYGLLLLWASLSNAVPVSILIRVTVLSTTMSVLSFVLLSVFLYDRKEKRRQIWLWARKTKLRWLMKSDKITKKAKQRSQVDSALCKGAYTRLRGKLTLGVSCDNTDYGALCQATHLVFTLEMSKS